MKAIIFILFIVLINSANVLAQCKFKINGKDDFTGQMIKETKPFSLAMGLSENFTFSLRCVDNEFFIRLFYSTTGNKEFEIPQDGELMFKLSDNTIITLRAIEESSSVFSAISGMATTSIESQYIVSKEQLQQLSNNITNKVRFYTTGGYIEKETSSGGKEKFKSNILCMLK